MKTKRVPAQELSRGMIFELFDRKYIIADVDLGGPRRSRRYYNAYNNRCPTEEDCRRSAFVEVAFFILGSHDNISMQRMVVSDEFKFLVQKETKK